MTRRMVSRNMIVAARGDRFFQQPHPIPVRQMVVRKLGCMARETRIRLVQKLRSYIRVIPHHEDGQAVVGRIETCVRFHDGNRS